MPIHGSLWRYPYCTLRREIRSFRVDRLSGVHPVTHPNDAVAA